MSKNILSYPAIFSKEEKGYSVFIPDLNSSTCGENLQDTIYMAKDLIGALAVEYIDYDKIEMPKASDVSKLKVKNEGDFVILIELDFGEYRKALK